MDSPALLATAAFEHAVHCLRVEYKDFHDGEAVLIPLITSKLEASFNAPPLEDFEYGCRKVFTADELRVLLFNPLEAMIKFYPVMLTFVASQPTAANEKIKGLLLSLVYLVHRRSWCFLEEFVLCGGLSALALLVAEPTLQLRGQVMEVLLQVTDCDAYDWFKKADSSKDATLHAQLLGLAESQAFLPGLMANRRESYPGGSMRALQILAFFVSWVRAMYTEDRRLVLGQAVLAELLLWSQGQGGGDISEDERSLAAALHKDFAVDQFQLQDGQEIRPLPVDEGVLLSGYRAPVVASRAKHLIEIPQQLQSASTGALAPSVAESDNAAAAAAVPLLDRVRERREAGNALFKQGELERALDAYALALDELPAAEASAEAREEEVSLHYNRAAVFWKMARAMREGGSCADDLGTMNEDEDDSLPGVFELQRCEQACLCALRLEPGHVKSAYRLVSALLLLRRPQEGLAAVDATLARIVSCGGAEGLAAADISGGEEKQEVLRSVRRKCVAALLLREAAPGAAPLLDSKTSKVLSALQNRSRRERGGVSHAWNGFVLPDSEEGGSDAAVDARLSRIRLEEVMGEEPAQRRSTQQRETRKKAASAPTGSSSGGATKSRRVSKKALEAVSSLRTAARAFDGPTGRIGLAARAATESGRAALGVLKEEGCSISSALSCLEEPVLLLLLSVALQQHAEGTSSLAAETLSELGACDRFDTTLRLALFGQRELGAELLCAAGACLGQGSGGASLLRRIESSVGFRETC